MLRKHGVNIAVISCIEHPAILNCENIFSFCRCASNKSPCVELRGCGFRVFATSFDEHLCNISVVSIGLVNNEIGVVQPLEDIVKMVRQAESLAGGVALGKDRIYIHTDAVRFLGM